MIANNSKIVFFGDSLTQRTGLTMTHNPARRFMIDYAESYVDILVKKMLVHFPEIRFEYHNLGIGGNTVEDLLTRVDSVLALSPDWIVLFIGQNDANRFSPLEFAKNLEKLLDIFDANKIKVIQLSTTPASGEDNQKNRILNEYDEMIRRYCKTRGNHFAELKKPFEKILKNNESAENPIQVFNQGCHMSELGNILIADLVFDVIAGI